MYCENKNIVEAITFSQFVAHGKANSDPKNWHDDIPWFFSYKGMPVTHETDTKYIITSLTCTLSVTPDVILLVYSNNDIETVSIHNFINNYTKIK